MGLSLLGGTVLGELADTRGWYAIATTLHGGGTLRTVVYVDGDVTTKIIGARTVEPADSARHFAEIDRQARRVQRRLRGAIAAVVATWTAVALTLVALARNPASLLALIAIVVPIAIEGLQRRRRCPLTSAPQIAAAVVAVAGIALALVTGDGALLGPAIVVLVLNLAFLGGLALLRARVRKIVGAR